jgi:hypothetical protein
MADFRDDFPLDPPPIEGEDWATPSDRNSHDSVNEIRAYVAELTDMLRGMGRIEVQGADGRTTLVIGQWTGVRALTSGFLVEAVGNNRVSVSPSVVSGMGAWATVPKIGEVALTDDPRPRLNVSGKNWVALRMEVIPFGDLYFDDGDTQLYRVAEGAGTLKGDIEVVAYVDEDEMESDSRPASVNMTTGEPDNTGIYVIPLAFKSEGEWSQIGYSGPLGVRMCANGAFIALSPARGPGL